MTSTIAQPEGSTDTRPPRGMPLGLALAAGGFGIGLTEFVIAGLLPEVARDFDVTESAAGWLISGYALSVAIGGVGITLAVARLPPNRCCSGSWCSSSSATCCPPSAPRMP